jgi:hypothetical protein
MVRINDIHCIEIDTLSRAKAERFNGKSGGYAMINAMQRSRRSFV